MCCCQNTPLQTVTVQFVMYVQCAHITVRHNVLLSEHTVTDRHSTICYVRSVCTHYCNTQCVAVRTHRYRPSYKFFTYVQSTQYKWNIFLLHNHKQNNLYFQPTSIISNFPPNTPPVQFCALNTFRQNKKPAQFVITTAALKYSGTVCCYQKQLLLCTAMLAIPR